MEIGKGGTGGLILERTQLLEGQLQLLGKAARAPQGNPLHDCIFTGDGLVLREPAGVRRRGRPRKAWANEVFKEALEVCGQDGDLLRASLLDAVVWKRTVHEHCRLRR